MVLSGERKCLRGQSQAIAVALELKGDLSLNPKTPHLKAQRGHAEEEK